ncbi:MAG: FKBP-type peptidyl-prolyl cis-trans isomerase [FCB group bacterium]|nr:FKBP-type peptidyl-prolyl cis-trans isomerase [FCB group bacterium]
MKKIKWIAVLSALVLVASAQVAPAQDTPPADAPTAAPAAPAAPETPQPAPEVDMTKVSTLIGANMGKNLASQLEADGLEIDKAALVQAFTDALNGNAPTLDPAEMETIMKNLSMALPAMRQKAGEKNQAEGDAFLAENAKKEGIKTTTSGLQYRVIQEGTGKSPVATDRVKVQYTGKLINGKEFDSSYKHGKPAEFSVGGVIPGWTEALQLMKEGGKMEVFVPSKLAYGPRGQQGIPPNSTLIFEVELLEVMPGQAEPQGIELPTPTAPQGGQQPQ